MKEFIRTIENNDYDGVNPLDGSQKHPNKYQLMEKRAEQIDEAIDAVFKTQKADVLKRPAVGVVTLVQRELQKKSGIVIRNEEEQDAFDAEYYSGLIIDQICKFIGIDNTTDYGVLSEKIHAYCEK